MHGGRSRRNAAVDHRFVLADDLGAAAVRPGASVAHRFSIRQHERIGQRVRRDLALVVVRDVARLDRAAKWVAVRVRSEIRLRLLREHGNRRAHERRRHDESAARQYWTHLAISTMREDPGGTGYSNSIVA